MGGEGASRRLPPNPPPRLSRAKPSRAIFKISLFYARHNIDIFRKQYVYIYIGVWIYIYVSFLVLCNIVSFRSFDVY